VWPCSGDTVTNIVLLQPVLCGHVVATQVGNRALCRQLLTAETRIRSHSNPGEICDGNSGAGTDFPPSIVFFCCVDRAFRYMRVMKPTLCTICLKFIQSPHL
jgi:hypothetical protein